MATIVLTIDDLVVQRVLDGLVPVVAPGSSQGAQAKQVIIAFIKSRVRSTETLAAVALMDEPEVT